MQATLAPVYHPAGCDPEHSRLRGAEVQRRVLHVASLGPLVPATPFGGRVHSVFAQACNLQCTNGLLTIANAGVGDGPATLRLSTGCDLRDFFVAGEPYAADTARLRGRWVELRLAAATRWQPAASGPMLPTSRIQARLLDAWSEVARSTALGDGQPAAVVAALGDAIRSLDGDRARQTLARLAGWGQGLTPAGDDALVGLFAAMDALVHTDGRRRRFRHELAAALLAASARTTPIAAHYMRLAAAGHFTSPLLAARDALLGEPRDMLATLALQRVMDIGASSGADTLYGLLAALQAWLPTEPTR